MQPEHLEAMLKRLEGFDLKDTLLSEKEFTKKIQQNELISVQLREFLTPSQFLTFSHKEYNLLVDNFTKEVAENLPFRPRYEPSNYTKFTKAQVGGIVSALLSGLCVAKNMNEDAVA